MALKSAKLAHCAPRKIAEALIAHMELDGTWFASVEAAGPGFLNFRLSDKWYQDVLSAVESSGADYGRVDDGHGEKVMVEFVSANPTGPMTIGNARGGVLGDALASVLERAGYNVWREFYVNDAGNQVDLFGKSIEARYLQLIQGEDAVEFPDNGYHGECVHCGRSLENRNPEGALPLGTQLGGKYTVGAYLSADGDGLSYRGVLNTEKRFVLIKEYFPVTLCNGRSAAGALMPKEEKEVLFKTSRMDFKDLYDDLHNLTPATGLSTILDVMEENNTVYAVEENEKGCLLYTSPSPRDCS